MHNYMYIPHSGKVSDTEQASEILTSEIFTVTREINIQRDPTRPQNTFTQYHLNGPFRKFMVVFNTCIVARDNNISKVKQTIRLHYSNVLSTHTFMVYY